MNNIICRWSILLFGGVVICLFFYCSVICKEKNDFDGEGRISSYMFSRITIGEIKKFKDDGMMHGPIYFYFKSARENVPRLREWLRLHRQQELPRIFLPSVNYLRRKVDWSFDLDNSEVFAIYYCGGNIVDWGFDMLITDSDNRSVYVTSGYISNLSEPVGDFKLCEARN